MPEINVEISSNSEGEIKVSTDIPSNSLSGLMSALKKAKSKTNSILTDIVENRKSDYPRESAKKRSTSNDDEDCEESAEEEEKDSKKQKM